MSSNLTGGTRYKTYVKAMNLKNILCSHKDVYVYRKYNDFDFIEYQKCKDCNKVLNTLEGFDEDLRG